MTMLNYEKLWNILKDWVNGRLDFGDYISARLTLEKMRELERTSIRGKIVHLRSPRIKRKEKGGTSAKKIAPTVRKYKLKVTVEADGSEGVRIDLLLQLMQDIRGLQGYTMAGGIAVREVKCSRAC